MNPKVVIAQDELYRRQYPIVAITLYIIEEGRFCGMGMYLPNIVSKSDWNSYYSTLSWYKAVGW